MTAPFDPSSVNPFDAIVAMLALLAAMMGFMTGLLRSLATILGWVAAAPVAVYATPPVMAMAASQAGAALPQPAVFFGVLAFVGMVLARLLRSAVVAFVAPVVSMPDRLAGATLGAGRIGLVAVLLVLVFERIVPVHLQPQAFTQSRLRPVLSQAGAAGLKTLPPEIEALIDKLKREYRI